MWEVEEVGEGGTSDGSTAEATSFAWPVGTAAAVGRSSCSSGRTLRARSMSMSGSRGKGDSAGGAYGGGDAFRRGASLDEESRQMRPARKMVCSWTSAESLHESNSFDFCLAWTLFSGFIRGSGWFGVNSREVGVVSGVSPDR